VRYGHGDKLHEKITYVLPFTKQLITHVTIDRRELLIATEKSSHREFDVQGHLVMKKNKTKAAATSSEASAGIDIAPSALANLADKLKVDLARPVGERAQRSQKVDQKKEKTNREKPRAEAAKVDDKAKQKKDNSQASRGHEDSTFRKNKEPRNDTNSRQGGERNGKRRANGVKSVATSDRFRQSNAPSPKTPKEKGGNKEERKTTSTLLDEILALGGSQEDLELVQEIDTDEDIAEESIPQSKGNRVNEKTVSISPWHHSLLVTTGITRPTQVSWTYRPISRRCFRGRRRGC